MRKEAKKRERNITKRVREIGQLVHCACWRFDKVQEVERDKIDPRRRRRRSAEARSLSFFEFRPRSCRSSPRNFIRSRRGRSLKARLEENGTVNPFAILSISLTAIKVMSYKIDCPHKIVSSPFVVRIAYTILGSTKQMTASPLYSA